MPTLPMISKSKGCQPVDQLSRKIQNQVTGILLVSVIMNLLISVFLAWGILPVDATTLRFAGGFFLLIFVCLHGYYRYGWNNMVLFFCITLVITWTLESLSIATGIPFGKYHYTEMLGEKIGQVPIIIIPAYFFNGYLAWTLGSLFFGNTGTGIKKRELFLIPLVSSVIMVMWNMCFDPILSTIEGYWVWQDGGIYHGVPVSNFAGWFITVYLVFQVFALYLFRSGDQSEIAISHFHWYLFPVMFMVQGLPFLLYPFFRVDHPEIYRVIALITIMTIFFTAAINIIMIKRRIAQRNLQVFK
jgi:uncharacterized membrane protein